MYIYLIGSLRNPRIPDIGQELRRAGHMVFDDWYAAGSEADEKWKKYEIARGHSYVESLDGLAAQHVFSFDLHHLNRSEAVVLVLPAGRSGHLEFGYAIGQDKPGYILLDTPDRWDVMYKFGTKVTTDLNEIIHDLKRYTRHNKAGD